MRKYILLLLVLALAFTLSSCGIFGANQMSEVEILAQEFASKGIGAYEYDDGSVLLYALDQSMGVVDPESGQEILVDEYLFFGLIPK